MKDKHIVIDSVETFEAALAQLREAQKKFATFTQEQVDKIFLAAATAANQARIPLAKLAVEETGYGVVEDKVIKNHYAAEYIYNKYKNDSNEIGIDVSKWQGDIDFQKVKDDGATFVMMRIGVQTSYEGELSLDRYYENNIKNAKEAGLKVGVYLYSIATSKEEAIEHAKWVVEKLNGESLELPIVFDWENWSKWNMYKLSFHDINTIADSFIETVNQSGYTGMLYSSKFYLENIWVNKHNYPVWLAHYTENTSYKGDYIMWQLCNTGRINGIYGDVDIDILIK